jgi:hypothetical protein
MQHREHSNVRYHTFAVSGNMARCFKSVSNAELALTHFVWVTSTSYGPPVLLSALPLAGFSPTVSAGDGERGLFTRRLVSLIPDVRSFILQVPLTMVAFTAVALVLHTPVPAPAPWREKARRIDFAGSACLVCGLATLLTALDRGGNISWTDPRTMLALTLFAAFALTFALIETRVAPEPVAPARVLTNGALLPAYVCTFASLGCSVCTVFHVALYVQAVRGRPAAQAGAALLPSIGASVMGSLLAGSVIQRWGRLRTLTVAMYAVMVCGSIAIALSTGVLGHSYMGLEVGLAMMSVGNGVLGREGVVCRFLC